MPISDANLSLQKLVKPVSSYQTEDGTVFPTFTQAVRYSLVRLIDVHLEQNPVWLKQIVGEELSVLKRKMLATALVEDVDLITLLADVGAKYWNQVEMESTEKAMRELSDDPIEELRNVDK